MSGMFVGIVGFILFDIIAVVLVGLWRHRGSSSQAVIGPPPADLPDWVPQMAPGAVNLAPGASGMPDVANIIANVKAAAADGQLTDAEIQAMFPGAQIVRNGDATTVAHAASAQSIQVATSGGMQQYGSIDEIPDPALREQMRQMMSGFGTAAQAPPPPPPPPPAPIPPPPPA